MRNQKVTLDSIMFLYDWLIDLIKFHLTTLSGFIICMLHVFTETTTQNFSFTNNYEDCNKAQLFELFNYSAFTIASISSTFDIKIAIYCNLKYVYVYLGDLAMVIIVQWPFMIYRSAACLTEPQWMIDLSWVSSFTLRLMI